MEDEQKAQRLIPDAGIRRFHERVGLVIRSCGSVSETARMAGVSESVIRKWRDGQSEPSLTNLLSLAKAGGVSLAWLATGSGGHGMDDGGTYSTPDQPRLLDRVSDLPEDYSLVPLYDVSASAGHGAVVESEQVIDYLAFKRDWLRAELNATAGDLYLIEVDGESMEPTLRPGDIILIDRRNAGNVPRDGVYVLRLNGSLLVKRLQRMPGHTVRVSSDNHAYEPFMLAMDAPAEDMAIVGRVVWSGRRM